MPSLQDRSNKCRAQVRWFWERLRRLVLRDVWVSTAIEILGKELTRRRRPVGPPLMSPAGTGFAKVREVQGLCSCVFWLEGALDLAQISVWHPDHLTARV